MKYSKTFWFDSTWYWLYVSYSLVLLFPIESEFRQGFLAKRKKVWPWYCIIVITHWCYFKLYKIKLNQMKSSLCQNMYRRNKGCMILVQNGLLKENFWSKIQILNHWGCDWVILKLNSYHRWMFVMPSIQFLT